MKNFTSQHDPCEYFGSFLNHLVRLNLCSTENNLDGTKGLWSCSRGHGYYHDFL